MIKWQSVTLNALRIVAALLFMQHGAQKLFGAFGRDPVDSVLSLMGLAGVLEFYGGALILVGLFTRPVAFILAGEMAVAYFMAHFPRSLFPVQNGGEHTVLFCFTFLFFAAAGAGGFSIDGVWRRRRTAAGGAGAMAAMDEPVHAG